MIFLAHGEYHLSITNRVVVAILAGPNNMESFLRFLSDMETLVLKSGTEPWGLLFVALNTAIMSPEAEHLVLDFTLWAEKQNCRCTAWSVEHISGGKGMVKNQWERVFAETPHIMPRFFLTDKEAFYWLGARGFVSDFSEEDRKFIGDHLV